MDLNTLWFILIGVLFSGFFLLEGFDYGVGILLPFVGKQDEERRLAINAIGPFWDGNEVWMLTAGGALFAAFPHWYATLFSGFYLALVLMLFALIVRGVAFEFRSQLAASRWRTTWDTLLFIGSLVPALLWGVAVGNLVRGVPIDAQMNFTGNLLTLLNPFALLAGVLFVLLFSLHGALFLSLKTTGPVLERAQQIAARLWLPTLLVAAGWILWTFAAGGIKVVALLAAVIAAVALAAVRLWAGQRAGLAFLLTSVTIVSATVMVFATLFPNVMISTTNPAWSLTIYTAASSPYTLRVMTIVAVIFVPIVLLYQVWTYRVFRQRLTAGDLHY